MQEYKLMEFTHTMNNDTCRLITLVPHPWFACLSTNGTKSLSTPPSSSHFPLDLSSFLPIPPPPRPSPLLSGHLQHTCHDRQPMRFRPRPVLHLRGVHGLVQLQLQAREVEWVERLGHPRNTVGYNPLPCPPLLYLINLARLRLPWRW